MQERDIFIEAVQKTGQADCAAYLDAACAADTGLRSRVDRLLLEHERQQSFILDRPVLGVETQLRPTTLTPLGTVIGRYKLLEPIGEGGYGTVFMAEQTSPVHRRVALKIIKAGMDTRQVIARFEAERQALALMDHPNIARVFDAGVTDTGRPYFVMELVKGVSIVSYCDDHHLPPRARLELFVQVCQAVQHAHTKGIIHRDIKPSNVLVALYDGKPVPKVIDFGVAKATGQQLTERTMFTGFGDVIGTLEYMSPEQAEVNQLDVDTRSDIYSLGVLLYELLTGSTPLENKRVRKAALLEMLRVIREEEPQKPSARLSISEQLPSIAANRGLEPKKLSGVVHGELDWIVMKALEKDRGRRYDTANGFAKDIERYLNDDAVHACPPSAAYRFRKFARRNKAAFAAGVAAVVILLAGLVGLSISNVLIAREKNEKELARQGAEASATKALKQEALAKANAHAATTQESLARRRFYAAQMNLAMAAWEDGESTRTLELLEGQRPAPHEEDLRAFEWYHLWQQCHRGLRLRLRMSETTRSVHAAAFLPDGKTLVSANYSAVMLWDVATGHRKASFPTRAWALSVSPDGKRVAGWGEYGNVRLLELGSGKEVASFEGSGTATFSPDGSTMAVTRGGDVEFWDTTGKERLSVLHVRQEEGHRIGDFLFSPDGNRAVARIAHNDPKNPASWTVHPQTFRRDGATWKQDATIATHGWTQPAAFSPDSQALAIGGDFIKIYACDTGKEIRTLATAGKADELGARHAGVVHAVAFSPDGKSLTTAGGDRSVRVWDWQSGTQRASYPHPYAVLSVAYSPDGAMIASAGAGGALRVWNVDVPREPAVLRHPRGAVNGVAFSPDGKTLVTSLSGAARSPDDKALVASGGGVRLWNTDTGHEDGGGREITTLADSTGTLIALSHDGRTLAVRQDHDVELWDVPARHRTKVLQGHSAQVLALAFSCDDRTLASAGSDKSVKLWDMTTLQCRLTLTCPYQVSAVAFAPDGRTLATGAIFEHVVIWDTQTGRELRLVQGHMGTMGGWTNCVAFTPDGTTLAAASQTGTVRLWDLATGRLGAALQGHTDCARWLAFAPDGGTIATASDDATVRLWDVSTGQEKVTLRGHAGSVRSVAFSPDGQVLATGGVDATVRLWRASGDPVATALKTPNAAEEAFDKARFAQAWNSYAELRAAAVDPTARDPKRAVEFATRAVELAARYGPYWTTLGLAQYRGGKFQESIATLTKANELSADKADGMALFVLAMAHWQLGHQDEARRCYDSAIAWSDANRASDRYTGYKDELLRLQTEAQQLIDQPSLPSR